MFQRPTVKEHPFKAKLKKHKIFLWELRMMLKNPPSESILSRMLRGIDPMSPEVERQLQQIVDQLDGQEQPAAQTAAK